MNYRTPQEATAALSYFFASSAPYNDQMKVVGDMLEAIEHLPPKALKPMNGDLFVEDGNGNLNEMKLVLLQGVVPMTFGGTIYHTPVEIYFPTDYPKSSPLVYVRPTAALQIVSPNPYVDPAGLVYNLDVQRTWKNKQGRGMTISCLIDALSAAFADCPPLTEKPAIGVVTGVISSSSSGKRVEVQHTKQLPSPPKPTQQMPPRASAIISTSTDPLSKATPDKILNPNQLINERPNPNRRDELIKQLNRKLKEDCTRVISKLSDKIHEESNRNDDFEEKLANLKIELTRHPHSQIMDLRSRIDDVTSKQIAATELLRSVEQERDSLSANVPALFEMRVLTPYDAASTQAALLQAEIDALDETISIYTQKFSRDPSYIDLQTFTKKIRILSTELFTKKLFLKKIAYILSSRSTGGAPPRNVHDLQIPR